VTSRRPLRSIGRLVLIAGCLALVLVLALFLLPVYLDVTAFKGPIEEVLTEIVDAPTTVDEAQLNLSWWPTLRLSGVEVQGTGWENAPLFTAIHRAEIRFALLPLLRKDLRLKKFLASDLDIHLSRPEGREGNWPTWTSFNWKVSELAGVDLRDVTVFLDDRDIGTADAFIDNLAAGIARDRRLQLEIDGTFEGMPLSVTVSGPTLTDLSPKATDFPLAAELELTDLSLEISGTASRSPTGTDFSLDVQAESPQWAFLEALKGPNLPEIGGFELAAQLLTRGTTVELSNLRGTVGTTTVHGALSLETSSAPPHLSGNIGLGEVDLQPWLDWQQGKAPDHSQPIPLGFLSRLDASLELTTKSLTGVEQRVEDLRANLTLIDGRLSLPLQVQLASIPLTVQLAVHQGGELAEINAEIQARDVVFDQLRALIDIPEGLGGDLGQIDLDVSTEGTSLDQLIANLTARLGVGNAALTAVDENGEEVFAVALRRLRVDHRTGQPLRISTAGVLLEEDFHFDLETVAINDLIDAEIWPFRGALQGAGATMDLDGTLARADAGFDFELDFLLFGDRLGDLHAWVGFPSEAELPYRLDGHLRGEESKRTLELDEAMLGRTILEGAFAWDADREEVPLVADIHASAADLEQLQGLADPITDLDTGEGAVVFDSPVLPAAIRFDESKIRLAIDRLYRETKDFTDLNASLEFVQGRLVRSPFSFHYDASEFQGELELDLRGATPRFALDLRGSAQNLDEILHQESLITDSRITAEQLEVSIAAEGSSVRQIVDSADIAGELTNVRWALAWPGSEEKLDLRLGKLQLIGPKGEPIVLESDGLLDEEPIRLRITIRDFGRPQGAPGLPVPFHLEAELASAEIDLDGELSLPISDREVDLDLMISGKSLSAMSALAGRQLPDLGPYHLEGRLSLTDADAALRDFRLTLGESDLRGSLEYFRLEGRPTFRATLLSDRTRSVDYLPQRVQSFLQDEPTATQNGTLSELETPELSLEPLGAFDASIDLEIAELDTGTGPLEPTTLALTLDHGHLLLLANSPQASGDPARISARVEPLDRGVEADLQVEWVRQPYGLLVDIFDLDVGQGSWSLNLDLETHGRSFDELVRNLGGHIDFTDYPENFNAMILDLWGGGLIGSLMPVFKLGDQSRINCTVGRFVVDQGILKPELLTLDATRNRVKMRGFIDLPNNYVRLRLSPRPKQRSLINLATPVKIRGPLMDPSIHFTTGGVAVTAFRLSLWVYTVWMDLLRKPLPRDGSDICFDPQPRLP
jgi:uncharacterized protein involved in outer membrane biogenesis